MAALLCLDGRKELTDEAASNLVGLEFVGDSGTVGVVVIERLSI